MKLYVDTYKESGKWYQQIEIETEKEYPSYSKEYEELLVEKVFPYCPLDGYIVITDNVNNKLFHKRLYGNNAIRRIRNK